MSFQPGKWPDRACLAKVTANYFAALVAHDSSATQVRPPQSGLMKRLLCAASATLLLAGCSPPPTPNVNPAPAKLLRVYGTADPSLKIKVGTRYITTAQKCAQRTHSLSRNSVPLSKVVESTVDRSGVNYEATVSIDHFERGECGWRAYAIAIRASTGDGLSSGFPAADARDTGPIHSSEYKVWISDPAPGDPNAPESRDQDAGPEVQADRDPRHQGTQLHRRQPRAPGVDLGGSHASARGLPGPDDGRPARTLTLVIRHTPFIRRTC
jgi:hypothetical protein